VQTQIPTPTDPAGEFRAEFRTLTMLPTLVTAMNDEFHRSTLPHTSSDGAQALECGRQTIHSLALNAIATILVRDKRNCRRFKFTVPTYQCIKSPWSTVFSRITE